MCILLALGCKRTYYEESFWENDIVRPVPSRTKPPMFSKARKEFVAESEPTLKKAWPSNDTIGPVILCNKKVH